MYYHLFQLILLPTIGSVGCLVSICEVSKVKVDEKIIGRGVLADAIGSALAGVVGAFPNTVFSQNVGLIPLTRNASRSVATNGRNTFSSIRIFPKVCGRLINIMPQPVLGGVGIVMFGTIAAKQELRL